MRFEHALQAARGLGAADTHPADEAVRGLERAKWRLWHGRWPGCRRKLAALCRWAQRTYVRNEAGIGRLERHVSELLAYLKRNQGALVHYAARRRRGEGHGARCAYAPRLNRIGIQNWRRASTVAGMSHQAFSAKGGVPGRRIAGGNAGLPASSTQWNRIGDSRSCSILFIGTWRYLVTRAVQFSDL